MWQFGTSVFNKVVRWHRLGEVENVYVSYNFSHFAIYLQNLLKLVEIWRSSNKNKNAVFFRGHGVYNIIYCPMPITQSMQNSLTSDGPSPINRPDVAVLNIWSIWLTTCKCALCVWHTAFCLLNSLICDFMFVWFYVAVIVWFRPSCISCIFILYIFFYFLYFLYFFRFLQSSFCCFSVLCFCCEHELIWWGCVVGGSSVVL